MTDFVTRGDSPLPTLLGPPDQAPPVEQLIIVPLTTNGTCKPGTTIHQPAPKKGAAVFADILERSGGIPPPEWPSRCGIVGVVYVQGVVFARHPECFLCLCEEERAKDRHERPAGSCPPPYVDEGARLEARRVSWRESKRRSRARELRRAA